MMGMTTTHNGRGPQSYQMFLLWNWMDLH
jgi:hypothetical protein